MKKWQIVFIFLLISGMMTGCFSQDEEQQQIAPSQESGKKEPYPVQEPVSPTHQPQDEVPSSTDSLGKIVVQPPPASSASKSGQTAPAGAQAPSQTNIVPTKTVEQVAGKYKQELTSLRGYYAGQLQSLYGGALADVKANQDSKQAIFAKYSKRGNAIQEESQAKVNQVLARMKEELLSHQLPTEKVNEYRSTYYAELDSAKNKAMSQVKKALGM